MSSRSNYVAPGKRPVSSILSTIVELPNGNLTIYYTAGAACNSCKETSQSVEVDWADVFSSVPDQLRGL